MLLGHSRASNSSQHIVLVIDEDLQEFPWVTFFSGFVCVCGVVLCVLHSVFVVEEHLQEFPWVMFMFGFVCVRGSAV